MPICDEANKGLQESQFLKDVRKFSNIVGTACYGYAPQHLNSIEDVQTKVSPKIAALLQVIRKHPTHKHVIIVSQYEGETPSAYKRELGFALYQVFGALGESVMGFKFHNAVTVKHKFSAPKWSVEPDANHKYVWDYCSRKCL